MADLLSHDCFEFFDSLKLMDKKKLLVNTLDERILYMSTNSLSDVLNRYNYLQSANGLKMEFCVQKNIKNISFIRKRLLRLSEKLKLDIEDLLNNFPDCGKFIYEVMVILNRSYYYF